MCASEQQRDSTGKWAFTQPVVKTCNALKPTEIKASVFTDKLQRIHQLSPTQRLRRGHFHYVERQGQCKEQRATRRRHPLDLRNEAWGSPNVAMTCRKLWHAEIINKITVNDIFKIPFFNQNQPQNQDFFLNFCFCFSDEEGTVFITGSRCVRCTCSNVRQSRNSEKENHLKSCRNMQTRSSPSPPAIISCCHVCRTWRSAYSGGKKQVSPASHSYTTLLKLQGRLLDS